MKRTDAICSAHPKQIMYETPVPEVNLPSTLKFAKEKIREWAYFRSPDEIRAEPALLGYAHQVLRAFEKETLGITGVLCVDTRPTIYFRRDSQPVSWDEANRLHRIFWNQGIATVFVLADPQRVRIYSGQAKPVKEGDSSDSPEALVEERLGDIADLLELESLLHEIASGHYYRHHFKSFNEKQGVDEFLLRNLSEARNLLVEGAGKLREEAAHALLGRLIFLCYLTDRKIIDWTDYKKDVGEGVADIRGLLEKYNPREGFQRLYRLFERLQHSFNGSMFDQNLGTELRRLNRSHYEILRHFFSVGDVKTGQRTLGFWAYDFSVIPVETISAIYEDFLSSEDAEGKRKQGAYYTPRHLAEMVVDIALAGDNKWAERRYLDPACGSGIFLVTLFNRLASHWVFNNTSASYRKRADALLFILHNQLRGIDIKRTACRIACFSLYLAFLDQFAPRDLRDFSKLAKRSTRKILPKLLQYRKSPWREKQSATVIEADFLQTHVEPERFDCIIGNPPWAERGTKQKAWEFMERGTKHVRAGGTGCLLLPAKVFFNKTDKLQARWFPTVSVERVINLSDFSFILFEEAKCPALIVRFKNIASREGHRIWYETPKVAGTDSRDGIIKVLPKEVKQVGQNDLLAAIGRRQAPSFWKSRFSGTPRDWKLLDLLDQIPKLSRLTCTPYRAEEKRTRWIKGQGVQPDSKEKCKNPEFPWWDDQRLFLNARSDIINLFVFPEDCEPVGDRFKRLYFSRHPDLFEPPLVVVSQGFGKVAFCDFPVLFQDSLQSIALGSKELSQKASEKEILLFLTLFLRSRLAHYFLFHTAAKWGVERDKVHLFELLNLPFPLPEDEFTHSDAVDIIGKASTAEKALRTELANELAALHKVRRERNLPLRSVEFVEMVKEFSTKRKAKVDGLQARLDREIYRYFDLTPEEIALVEDTVQIIEPSSTPPNREVVRRGQIPTLQDVGATQLEEYAEMLAGTLNSWGRQTKVEASATVFEIRPFVLFHLRQSEAPADFHYEKVTTSSENLLERIHEAARQRNGRFEYPRAVTFFDGTSIHLLKPKSLVHWTRTAALNDADEIFAEVIRQRRSTKA